MGSQRFRAVIAADPEGRAIIAVPFGPDQAWGAKADHPVGGTIDGRRVRGRLQPASSGWALTLGLRWQRDMSYAVHDHVVVEMAPEGPQRGDIAAALTASPAAAAFFDTLAQFYRKAYLRWIDATKRRPDVRAARIAEVVDLLAAGSKNGHDRDGRRARGRARAASDGKSLPSGLSPRRLAPQSQAGTGNATGCCPGFTTTSRRLGALESKIHLSVRLSGKWRL